MDGFRLSASSPTPFSRTCVCSASRTRFGYRCITGKVSAHARSEPLRREFLSVDAGHALFEVSFEEWKFGAWPSLPPQAVKEEALKKQQQGGWDAVRPALDVTVR